MKPIGQLLLALVIAIFIGWFVVWAASSLPIHDKIAEAEKLETWAGHINLKTGNFTVQRVDSRKKLDLTIYDYAGPVTR